MRTNNDVLAGSGKLHRRELFLVVLLEGGTELGDKATVQALDVYRSNVRPVFRNR